MTDLSIDAERAVARLIRFLKVEGTSGREGAIGAEIAVALEELGVPADAMHFDDVVDRIPVDSEAGNLVVDIAATGDGARRLFTTHRDTVPSARGAVPQRDGDRVFAAGATALGGDDRAGVACLVTLVAELARQRIPHPPLTLLFTVHEESGLWGSRCLKPEVLGAPELAFNVDGASPTRLFVGAVGGASWQAEVVGRAAHAGLHPEQGVSATLVIAEALAEVHRQGWWGRIRRDGCEGTSNVGPLSGRDGGPVGSAANVVTDYARIEGEARSHDASCIPQIAEAYRLAFEHAAEVTRNEAGERAEVAFESALQYEPFRLAESSPSVTFAVERARSVGLSPELTIANGGLDANWIVSHGVPTVTFGIGQRNIHSPDEYLDIPEFLDGCRLAIALARS